MPPAESPLGGSLPGAPESPLDGGLVGTPEPPLDGGLPGFEESPLGGALLGAEEVLLGGVLPGSGVVLVEAALPWPVESPPEGALLGGALLGGALLGGALLGGALLGGALLGGALLGGALLGAAGLPFGCPLPAAAGGALVAVGTPPLLGGVLPVPAEGLPLDEGQSADCAMTTASSTLPASSACARHPEAARAPRPQRRHADAVPL